MGNAVTLRLQPIRDQSTGLANGTTTRPVETRLHLGPGKGFVNRTLDALLQISPAMLQEDPVAAPIGSRGRGRPKAVSAKRDHEEAEAIPNDLHAANQWGEITGSSSNHELFCKESLTQTTARRPTDRKPNNLLRPLHLSTRSPPP